MLVLLTVSRRRLALPAWLTPTSHSCPISLAVVEDRENVALLALCAGRQVPQGQAGDAAARQ